MEFTIAHTFEGISVSEYEQLYFDEPFNDALFGALDLGREVLQHEERAGQLEMLVTIRPKRQVSGTLSRAIQGDRLDYTEQTSYQWGSYEGAWSTTPAMLANSVDSCGTFAFQPVEGGVRRVVSGRVNVALFGLGRLVERFVVSSLHESHDQAARFTQQWIFGQIIGHGSFCSSRVRPIKRMDARVA